MIRKSKVFIPKSSTYFGCIHFKVQQFGLRKYPVKLLNISSFVYYLAYTFFKIIFTVNYLVTTFTFDNTEN